VCYHVPIDSPVSEAGPGPGISVVIPVFNEEDNLRELGERLISTLTAMGRPYEIIFVDDGSTDGSWQLLTDLHRQYPQNIRALQFHRNFGQHQAIFAGFQAAKGKVMVTLDADLQNPRGDSPPGGQAGWGATIPWGVGGRTARTPSSGGSPPNW
jgi:cellulose synthase/poly-beta-1,6-N-acetylglucosamine synthase-like glycosyltransferase